MQVHIETEINAPAETVWEILGQQFAEIATWSTIVETSRPLRASEVPPDLAVAPSAPVQGRVTRTPVGELREVLTMYSDEGREFIFRAADVPPFVTYAHNHSRVIEKGPERSLLSFDIRMDPKGIFNLMSPLLRRRFMSTYGRVQADLKHYAETGSPAQS